MILRVVAFVDEVVELLDVWSIWMEGSRIEDNSS